MKKVTNLKKIFSIILCFVFGLVVSGVFAFHANLKVVPNLDAAQVINLQDNNVNGELNLTWNAEDRSNIQPMSASNETKPSDAYYFDVSNVPETIVGGTVITIKKEDDGIHINFDAEGTENDGHALLKINDGYLLESIDLGNGKGESVELIKTVLVENFETFSITVEELDPNYSGELYFAANTKSSSFDVDFFYRKNGTYSNANKFTIQYGIGSPITESVLNVKQYYVNNEEVEWYFSESAAGVKVKDEVAGGDIQFTVGMVNFTFSSNSANIINVDGNKFYKILQIGGKINGVESVGNFTAEGGQQDAANPTIIARSMNQYTFNIQNEGKAWNSSSNDFGSSYWVTNTVSDADLYGVKVTGSKTRNTTLCELTKVHKNSTIEFLDGKNKSFNKNFDISNGYCVYNYGFSIIGYVISYENGDGETKYLDHNGTTFTINSTKTLNSIDDLENVGFGAVASFLDNYVSIGMSSLPVITITPAWSAANVEVKYGDEESLGTLSYGDSDGYALTENFEKEIGKEVFAYTHGENLIATSAVWNYYRNSFSYGYIDNGENSGAGRYTLSVEPVYVDNIYRVELTNVKLNSSNAYQLVNTEYVFNFDSGSCNASCLTYKDGIEGCKYLPYNNQKFVDDYITNLAGYQNDYEEKIDGDGDNDFDMFKIVYYSSGEVSKTVKEYDTLSQADDQSFYIYLANAQQTGALPAFKNSSYTNIFWKNTRHNDESVCSSIDNCTNNSQHYIYLTDEYDEGTHKNAISSYSLNEDGTWHLSDGHDKEKVVLYASYYGVAYYVDFFYRNADGNYDNTSKHTISYSAENPITNNTFTEEQYKVNGVAVEWMFRESAVYDTVDIEKIDGDGNIQFKLNTLTFILSSEVIIGDEGSRLFKILQVGGAIDGVEGYGNFINGDGQDVTNPTIVAREANEYAFKIENEGRVWNSSSNELDLSYWIELLKGVIDDTDLYGVKITGDEEAKTTLGDLGKLNESSSTQFITEQGLAFNGEFEENIDNYGGYYVYNYGFEIIGYLIKYSSGGLSGYIDYNSGSFTTSSTGVLNLVGRVSSITFGDVIEYIDSDVAPGMVVLPEITIIPVWSAANIEVEYNGSSLDTFTYGSAYTLDATFTKEVGKEVFGYTTDGADLIAPKAVWNYYRNDIDYDFEDETYTVSVEPIYVDNIYRVELTNVKLNSSNAYQLVNTDYVFNSTSGSYNASEKDYLTYADSALGYGYEEYDEDETVLVEDYVEKLSELKNDYITRIANASFEMFRKVYYSSGKVSKTVKEYDTLSQADDQSFYIYLANAQQTGALPAFKNSCYTNIFWKNTRHNDESACSSIDDCTDSKHYIYLTNEYDDGTQNGVISSYTVKEGGTWHLSDGHSGSIAVLHAGYYEITYYVDFFYRVDGVYSDDNKYTIPYSVENPITTSTLAQEQYHVGGEQVDWLFKVAVGTSVLDADTSQEGTQYFAGTLVFTFSSADADIIFVGESKLYKIVKVGGTINGVNGYGNFIHGEGQNANSPTIVAREANEYAFKIENEGRVWNSSSNELSSSYWITNSVEKDLYGVKITGAEAAKTTSGYLESVQDKDSEMKFITGKGLAFNTTLDVGTFGYCVYNYGFNIVNYLIKYSNDDGLSGYIAYNGSSFTTSSTAVLSSIIKIENLTFGNVIEYIDSNVAPGMVVLPEITIIPVWSAAKIKVEYNGSSLGEVSYGSAYTLNATFTKEVGKEVFAYTANGTDLIATSAVWNYYRKTISYGYTDNSTNSGAGTYDLNVTPVYVDNIYKVELTNAKVNANGDYQLINTKYTFNSSQGSYDTEAKDCLTYKDEIDGCEYLPYNKQQFVEDYITDLAIYKQQYETSIKKASFGMFRKVYYNSGEVQTYENANDLLTKTSGQRFYIYLANGQETGELPAFKTNYYTQIFWQNTMHNNNTDCVGVAECSNPQHYIYLTNEYDKEIHEHSLYLENGNPKYLWHDNAIWNLSDGHNASEAVLHAFYYRRYYFVEVSTLLENNIERRGYVRINIVDRLHETDNSIVDRSGNYVAIAEVGSNGKTQMANYIVGSSSGSLLDTYVLDKVNPIDQIKLYDGCDIDLVIYDQSKDVALMESGSADEMIGYKYSGKTEQVVNDGSADITDVFKKNSTNDYLYLATYTDIVSKDYKATSTFEIVISFDKIIYSLVFKIDNSVAGEFNIQTNKVNSGYKTQYTLNDIVVENYYKVDYYAFAGFKLQQNAFVMNSLPSALQTYDDYNINQEYVLTKRADNLLDGTWLRECYYTYNASNYPVNNANLGILTIQTEVIEFNYGVIIYDETDTAKEKGIVETFEDGTFSLDYSTGKGVAKEIGAYLTNNNKDFWYYKSLDGQDYALLSSRMLIPSNPTSTTNNFYNIYDFKLLTKPLSKSTITSNDLAYYVDNFEDGKIIAVEDRNVFVVLEVRKLYTITMQVLAEDENDSNNSVRTTTLYNGDNNSKAVTITAGRGILSSFYFVDEANVGTSVSVYTYHGLNNVLISRYDETQYEAVKYYLGSTLLESDEFKVEANSNLKIEYVPKTLDVEYVYVFEGYDITESKAQDYINITKPELETDLKVGNRINYSVELLDLDYNVRVSVNGHILSSTDKYTTKLECFYIVSDADMALGTIKILTEIYPKQNAQINLNFVLANSSKKDVDDDYGTFDVYVDDALKAEEVSSAKLEIVEGKDVYLSLNLPMGYSYVGIKKGSYSVQEIQPVAGKILLIEDFDLLEDSGDYLVVVDKNSISAILDTTDVKTKDFKAYINGKQYLDNLYVGSNVNLTYLNVNKEHLDYFYYTYGEGEDAVEVELISQGADIYNFKITNEVLEQSGGKVVKFGVKTISRFNLILNVEGQEYLSEPVSITYVVDNAEYKNGTYCDEGTQLTFSVQSAVESKYDIIFDGNTYDVININDFVITLYNDYIYLIEIKPKQYGVEISENLYSSLTQLKEQAPDSVTTNQVNNLNVIGQSVYNSTTTLEVTRVAYKYDLTTDRELYRIIIEDNDAVETIIVEFDGVNFVALVDDEEIDLADHGYFVEISGNIAKLTYTTLSNISITLDYKDYKVINVG